MITSVLNLTSVKVKTTIAHLSHSFKNTMTINSLLYKCKTGSVFQKEQKKNHQFNETKTLKSASLSSYASFMNILESNRKSTKSTFNKKQENNRYPRSIHEYMNQNGVQPNNNNGTESTEPISQNNTISNREYIPFSNSSGTDKENHQDSVEECLYRLKFRNSREYSSYKSVIQSSDSSNDSTTSWKKNETEFWRLKSSLSQPPNIPFLPMFIGNGGNSIKSSKSVKPVVSAARVARIISQEIQNPSSMPGQQTLNKFSILIQVLKTMSSKEMRDVTKELYSPLSNTSSSSSPDALNHTSW